MECYMIRRVLSLFAAFLFVFLAIDIVTTSASFPTNSPTVLVTVGVPTSSELEKFVESGVPAFASLTGQDGDYLIAGASKHELARLESLGLKYQVLTEDTSGKAFYIASPVPNIPAPKWLDLGAMLLDDGNHVLLQVNESETINVDGLGARLQRMFLEPIVLNLDSSNDRFSEEVTPDPVIQSMMDQVISSTLHLYTGNLSGEWKIMVGGAPYTIYTRYTNSGEPIQKATEYVTEHLENLGLDIEHHIWGFGRPPNVIGEMTGETHPEDVFLITAHLDSTVRNPPEDPNESAPGADDNASGSTGVMVASEIFSQYRWGCTMRFVFFTGEEQGLLGSNVYADRLFDDGENILGVLNMDMIGYNTPGTSRTIDLEGSVNAAPASMDIANLFADVIDAYSIDLIPEVSSSTCCSDHVPFLQNGFPAILAIEDFSDFNPAYHSTGDLLSNLDMDYFTDLLKASVGTFAHMTDCRIGFLDGHVQNVEGGSPIDGAEVKLKDTTGRESFVSTNSSGYFTVPADIGTYTVTVSASGFIPTHTTNVEITFMETTTEDFYLVKAKNLLYFPIISQED